MQKVKRILMMLAALIAAGSLGHTQNLAPIFPIASSPRPPGADFDVEVKVGDSAAPVSNLFGVSFELNYTNTNFIDVVGTPSPGDILGNDIVFFPNVDDANGKVGVGISRKLGQSGVTGNGTVLKVKFKTLITTPGGTAIQFTLTNVAAIDPNSVAIVLEALPLMVTINQVLPVALVEKFVPETFELLPNYPNPFNPLTTITFILGRTQSAYLSVYDVSGHEVAVLFNRQAEAGQLYRVDFNGAQQASGVYIFQLRVVDPIKGGIGKSVLSRKMLLLR